MNIPKYYWVLAAVGVALLLLTISPSERQKPKDAWKRNPVYAADGTLLRSKHESPPVIVEQVNAIVRKSMTHISIANSNSFDWGGATLYLNGQIGGYRAYIGRLQAGKSTTIPLIEFTKRSGERFQPLQFAPKELVISVNGHEGVLFGF